MLPPATWMPSLTPLCPMMHEARRSRYHRPAGGLREARPAPIIQADLFEDTGTVTVLLVSEALLDAPLLWPTVRPTPENGLGNRHR